MKARILVTRNEQHGGVHGRLLLAREDGWHVCGVFQLRRQEWLAFASICAAHEIEINHETLPAESTSSAAE